MTTYETVFITLPSLTEDEETDLVASFAKIVSDDGGDLVANERMGRRRLAYPLRKFEDGVYTRFLYDAPAEVPKELDRRIRLSDKVLRHLTVRLEPGWAVASKEQAVRDEQARKEAAIAAAAAAAEAAEAEARRLAEAAAKGESEPPTEAAPGEADDDVPAKAEKADTAVSASEQDSPPATDAAAEAAVVAGDEDDEDDEEEPKS